MGLPAEAESSSALCTPPETRRRGAMGLPAEADEHIRKPVGNCLGASASPKTLQLGLLASEDERRRLQDRIFLLEDRLVAADRRLEQYNAEASMNAQGLRRHVEEKEAMASGYAGLASRRAKLEKECALYERDIEKFMGLCDELAREHEELKAQVEETSVVALNSEVESLRKDKEHLRINLHRAEEEVKALFQENTVLGEDNKRLLRQLNEEDRKQGSGSKNSAGASAKVRGKRKSSPNEILSLERPSDINNADLARQPLLPLQHNSPGSRLHKK